MANEGGGKHTNNVNAWLGLAGKLVWPVFIIIMIALFHGETGELYTILKKRIESGASVKLGGFLELGEWAGKTEISELALPDLPVEAIGGPAEAVMKGSSRTLDVLRQELSKSPYRRVDTLMLDSSVRYSPYLLKDYINTLGVRFVVFRRNGNFDGWIEAGLFLSQILNRPDMMQMTAEELKRVVIPYDELREGVVGLSKVAVQTKDSARVVLQAMQDGHTDNLPVLDGKRFRFFANRGEILANLISKFILEKKEDKGNGQGKDST